MLPVARVAPDSALVFAVSFLKFASFLRADVTVVRITISRAVKLRSFTLKLPIFLRRNSPAAPVSILLHVNVLAVSVLPASVLPVVILPVSVFPTIV